MLRVSAAIACAFLVAMLTSCGAQDCGCGASSEDPLAMHDLSYAGDHELTNACACRCADGPLQPHPFDDEGGCDHEGATCIDDAGFEADLVCSG